MQVVIDDQTHAHDDLIVDLTDHADKFWLKLSKSLEHVAESLTALTWFRLVNHLIREVDVALDKVHVGDELLELCWHLSVFHVAFGVRLAIASILCSSRFSLASRRCSLDALLVLITTLSWHNRGCRELNASFEQGLVYLREVRERFLFALEFLTPFLDQVCDAVLDLLGECIKRVNARFLTNGLPELC